MNNKEPNVFFNTDQQNNVNNMNTAQAEQDRREYKYNNGELPQVNRGGLKFKKFYINIRFPFLKYIVYIAVLVGVVAIIINLPYNKFSNNVDTDKYCLIVLDYGDIYSEKIKCGETYSEPQEPVKEGYEFIGWYNGEEKYDFSQNIKGNVTLVAKWEERKPEEVMYNE